MMAPMRSPTLSESVIGPAFAKGIMQHAVLQAGTASKAAQPAARTPEEALALLSAEGGGAVTDSAVLDSLDAGAAALWFKKEAFTAPEFDPDEYVRDLQRFVRALCTMFRCSCRALFDVATGVGLPQVPLESLRAALDAHLSTLKTEVCAPRRRYQHVRSLGSSACDVCFRVGAPL